jgi:hypothetical protein
LRKLSVCILSVLIFGFCLFTEKKVYPNNEVEIKILKRVNINIHPPDSPVFERFLTPPLDLDEGLNKEILVRRGNFLEVFSEEGKAIKRVGGEGEGPGEIATLITHLRKTDQYYYLLDLPNQISIFDEHFSFIKRFFLETENGSRNIYNFDVGKDIITTVQEKYQGLKEERRRKPNLRKDTMVIMRYDGQGRFKNAFLKQKEGREIYPDTSILGGNILIHQNKIFFAYQSINKIWEFDFYGRLVKERNFGKAWWRSVIYDEKEYKKVRLKSDGAFMNFFAEVYASGDIIDDIYIYKGHLLVRVLKGTYEKAINSFILLDLNLENEIGPLQMEGYHLSGVGEEYLYFTRYVSEYSAKENMDVEVLICDIEI